MSHVDFYVFDISIEDSTVLPKDESGEIMKRYHGSVFKHYLCYLFASLLVLPLLNLKKLHKTIQSQGRFSVIGEVFDFNCCVGFEQRSQFGTTFH